MVIPPWILGQVRPGGRGAATWCPLPPDGQCSAGDQRDGGVLLPITALSSVRDPAAVRLVRRRWNGRLGTVLRVGAVCGRRSPSATISRMGVGLGSRADPAAARGRARGLRARRRRPRRTPARAYRRWNIPGGGDQRADRTAGVPEGGAPRPPGGRAHGPGLG